MYRNWLLTYWLKTWYFSYSSKLAGVWCSKSQPFHCARFLERNGILQNMEFHLCVTLAWLWMSKNLVMLKTWTGHINMEGCELVGVIHRVNRFFLHRDRSLGGYMGWELGCLLPLFCEAYLHQGILWSGILSYRSWAQSRLTNHSWAPISGPTLRLN